MALADAVSFFANASGTGTFFFGTARSSFRTPAQAVADNSLIDGQTYSYLAQDSISNPQQREWGRAVFTAANNSFARSPIGGVSAGTDTGATAVNFTSPPLVSITILQEDVRQILSANTNYYVATTGNDANPGTLAKPWATLQHALLFVGGNLELNSFTVTINLGAGSFVGAGLPYITAGAVLIVGAGSASTTLTPGTNDGVYNFGECLGSNITTPAAAINIDKLKFAPVSGAATLSGEAIGGFSSATWGLGGGNGTISTDLIFDCTNAGFAQYIQLAGGSLSDLSNGTTGPVIHGGGGSVGGFFALDFGATISLGQAWTISGSLTVAPFALVIDGSKFYPTLADGFSITGGTVTGQRFNITSGGALFNRAGAAGSLGPNFIPGSTPGKADETSNYDGFLGTNLLYPQPTTTIRTVLTANTNFYVATTGSDSNSGSSTSPWATLTHAFLVLTGKLDANQFFITINVGAGTFAGGTLSEIISNGGVQIQGAGSASTTFSSQVGFYLGNAAINGCTINGSSGAGGTCISANTCAYLALGDYNYAAPCDLKLKPANTGGSGAALNIQNFSNVETGTSTTGTIAVVMNGNALVSEILVDFQSYLLNYNTNWVFSGTTDAAICIQIIEGSNFYFLSGTWSGTAPTGNRFDVTVNSSCQSPTGQGLLGFNFFPGTVAGIADAASSYDGFPGPIPGINLQTGSYTLIASDASSIVEMNAAGANTLTVPTDASVPFVVGSKVQITQIGAGATTIAGAGGVTVHNAGAISAQWGSAMLYKRGTNEWVQTVA